MLEKENLFLTGLNIDLEEVRGRVLGSDPISSIHEVFATVRREDHSLDNSALKTETASTSNQRNFKKNDDKCKRPRCDHCNKLWHTRDTCWKIYEKPAHLKNGKTLYRNNRALHIIEERKQEQTSGESSDNQFTKEQWDLIQDFVS
ncbi:LOW QUALITY PROTEIN: hypothetical protein TorRG33x02_094450 [Trema orientale]|uniref:Uncharacterized protein n=1 Tax=Trema orientale TaxID=63057 RepID=A0A2P5FA46_TREOI|nr:LOW QUALITY PROTEIN: hypothetical protein TorRG33x02_094450 [Trema orientale]